MEYRGTVIRPPSEAFSLILQVTLGCSHNRCAFCGTYRDKPFAVRPRQEIIRDLESAARSCPDSRKVFLADGDVLVLGVQRLAELFADIRSRLPEVRRISLYGSAANILRLKREELARLKSLGLSRVYMGLESGHGPTLRRMGKGSTPEEMIRAGRRIREAGLFLSVTCLLGLGGQEYSKDHARDTARVLTAMGPSQVAILTLMILENTELALWQARGEFTLPDRNGLLRELRRIIACLGPIRCQVQANHASNYLALDGRWPRDRERFLARIDTALAGECCLRPESARRL